MSLVCRINLWSGPRNVSTALMYAFAERADTRVVDEPLYAHYLLTSGAVHPGRDEVLAEQVSDGASVIRDVVLGASDRPVVFFKQMAHHLTGVDRAFLEETEHVLLVRDPREMLPSLLRNVPEPTLEDTGLAAQTEILTELRALGKEPPVLDARALLEDPEGVLRQLCDRLGLPFDPGMLSWAAGPRTEDGIWAPYWYANVHRSTGFEPWKPKEEPVPARFEALLEACLALYGPLERLALRGSGNVTRPGRTVS